jgi:HlyD family secretion protein
MQKSVTITILILIAISMSYYHFFKRDISVNLSKQITLYGNVDIRDVNLSFRVSGKIAQLFLEEGDFVKKGDVLAMLDAEPLEKEIDVKNAQLEAAQVALESAAKEFERQKMLHEKFNAVYHEDSVYNLLKKLDLVWISARSRHPKSIPENQENFKK